MIIENEHQYNIQQKYKIVLNCQRELLDLLPTHGGEFYEVVRYKLKAYLFGGEGYGVGYGAEEVALTRL